MLTRHSLFGICFLYLTFLLTTCRTLSPNRYEARIRWTGYGIPHIEARDLGSLGFGDGYAQARDHLCDIADQVVRARGERARYFGPGEGDRNLDSDFGMRALGALEWATTTLESNSPEVQDWYNGFAAGYNKWLLEKGQASAPDWCRGAGWLVPIEGADILAYNRIVTLASTSFAEAIGASRPPDGTLRSAGRVFLPEPRGSNGWALGRDRTESGRGMFVANPHYAWKGSNRFWEKHLTIPGDLNVYGITLVGFPGVDIGFTEGVAWTQTISAGERLTIYRLQLSQDDPTHYRFDQQDRAMTARTFEVAVLRDNGTLETVARTLYSSHHGPILHAEGLEWTGGQAFSLRDANDFNIDDHRQVLAMDRARTLEEFQQTHVQFGGLAWVNTVAGSADGRAWYTDAASTPRLSQAALAAWQENKRTEAETQRLWRQGMVLLDGSTSLNEWIPAADDPRPVLGWNEIPRLERTDYVFNSNDSYWVPHHEVRLTGFSPLQGGERSPLSLRTRMNVRALSDVSPSGPAGPDGKFNLDELTRAILDNRGLAAELLLPELTVRCRRSPQVSIEGQTMDLKQACAVLANWDGRYDLDSRGAVLFREFLTRYPPDQLRRAGSLFATDFDPEDPIETPRGLAPATAGGDFVLHNLARAVQLLETAGVALDSPLGDLQFADREGKRIPIHGGSGGWEGLINVVQPSRNGTTMEPQLHHEKVEDSRFLTSEGYPIGTGTSFLLVVEFREDGPAGRAFLTYGQSEDPESVHFRDQTELFSRKEWRPVLFSEDAIQADTQEEITIRGER